MEVISSGSETVVRVYIPLDNCGSGHKAQACVHTHTHSHTYTHRG